MRQIATKKKPVFVQANSNSGPGHVLHYITSFCVVFCQHFISHWLGKLKPNKLSTGCQNELKGAAVEKATNPGRRFLFFSRLRARISTLLHPARQNRHATQANWAPEVEFSPFRALSRRQMTFPFCYC